MYFPNCQSVHLSNYFLFVCFFKYLNTTHMGVLCLIWSLKVPVDRGHGGHLAPHLTGDAAQFKAFMGHSLCVWVHLHTGSMAKRHYRVKRMEKAVRSSCHYVLLLPGYLEVTGFRVKSRCWPSFSFSYICDVEWLIHGQNWCFQYLSTRRQTVNHYFSANFCNFACLLARLFACVSFFSSFF